MLFYVQMRWEPRGLSHDELMKLELRETQNSAASLPQGMKVIGIWKVASQHRVIVIVDVESAEILDNHTMFTLPMRGNLEYEQVWALCDYGKFAGDLTKYVAGLNSKHKVG